MSPDPRPPDEDRERPAGAEAARRPPLVSVVMPFLDPPVSFFREAIESVLAQTLSEWELLLVNDGSGPEASRFAEEAAARDPDRIRVLAHPGRENRGVPAARNLGIAFAASELIAFLDADDLWLPERLEHHLELLRAHGDAAMAYGPSLYWRSWHAPKAEDVTPPTHVPAGVVMNPIGLLAHLLRGAGAVPCPTSVTCRTRALREVGGFIEGFPVPTEDQAFYVRFLLAHPAVVTDRTLDRYRLHPDSATGSAEPDEEASWRRVLLAWALDEAGRHAPEATGLHRVIRDELRLLDRPLEARLRRTGRRLVRRLGLERSPHLVPLASSQG